MVERDRIGMIIADQVRRRRPQAGERASGDRVSLLIDVVTIIGQPKVVDQPDSKAPTAVASGGSRATPQRP